MSNFPTYVVNILNMKS